MLLSTIVMLAATSGCTTINSNWIPKAPWDKKDQVVESQYDTPVRMAAIWTPDVMVRPGMPASRGFGGRLYFYNQVNKPVKVEGQLVVYAYDDSAAEPHNPSCDVSLRVSDVQSLWNELKDRSQVIFGLRDNSWGDTSFCIADPGGFRLTFFSPTG